MRKLAVLAVALTVLMGSTHTMAQYSPLPTRSPLPSLEECYARCDVDFSGIHRCLCRRSVRCKLGLETACQPDDYRAECYPCPRPGMWRMSDWMGAYPLWTDGHSYCVEVP